MSTVVYQELQPCYECDHVESRRLSLIFNSSDIKSTRISDSTVPENINMLGWKGIDGLASNERETEEGVYVHPVVKRSSSALSQKSLEMCTESLGCETGTCIMDISLMFSSKKTNVVKKSGTKWEMRTKEAKKVEFPPPLTTITASNSIHIERFREHGRLVIKTVTTPTTNSYLQAERSQGRLKLSFRTDFSEQECCVGSEEGDGKSTDPLVKQENEGNECDESMNLKGGNNLEFGFGKMQRISRCMEIGQGNKRLINIEPFWVVT